MIDIQKFENAEQMETLLAESVSALLTSIIDEKGQATLCVPGGKTPLNFLHLLASQSLEWAKVKITLTDERWVSSDAALSNERLIREQLLRCAVTDAWFIPLKLDFPTAVEAVQACEEHLMEEIAELDVVVLGMGDDGHFASLFPHDPSLEKGLDCSGSARCVAVTSQGDVQRISLTLPFLLSARKIILLIKGQKKWDAFQRAIEPKNRYDASEMPIRAVINQDQVPFQVYWSPE